MTTKKKITIVSGSILILLLTAMVLLPIIFKDKIIASIKKAVNENIRADVDFGDVDVTLFRHFPYLTVSIDSISIAGRDAFKGDTLLQVARITATADIMSVVQGNAVRIRSIYLNTPHINLIVLEDGRANWDIAIPDTTPSDVTEPSKGLNIELKRYGIKSGHIVYDDRSMGLFLRMQETLHKGKGDFADDFFSFSTTTEVGNLDFVYGGVKYISKAKANLSADLDMDMKAMKFTFKDNDLRINELALGMSGFIAMPQDPIEMDLKFDIRKNEFSHFVSLLPGAYKKDFDKAKSSGTLAMNGFIKGVYSETTIPGFGVNLKIEKGQFSYPDLPVSLNNVNVDLRVNNPDGVPDHTVINLEKMHVEIGKDPFDMRLLVKTPVSDPQIDGQMKGRVDLSGVASMFPLEQETKLAGVLNADVAASGRMSAIENKRYQYFRAEGMLTLEAFKYVSSDFKNGIEIPSAELIFNPKNITLNKFALKTGKTSLTASGWVDNMLGYMFKENELLSGTLDINAQTIDLNEFMSENSDSTANQQSAEGVLEIPKNIDFQLTAKAQTVHFRDLTLTDASGNLAVRDRTLGLNGIGFNMLDGRVGMNGVYESKDLKKPFFFFTIDLNGLDVRKTYDAFVSVKKLAPIAEKASGKYTASLNMKGDLDGKMEPIYSSLTGGGKLSTSNITIDNFKPLVKIADALRMEQFKKFTPGNLNLSFKFENGRVNVDPFDLTVAGIKSTVSGSNGFDMTIDYTLVTAIPIQMAGAEVTGVINSLLSKANSAAGTNLSVGKEAKVRSRITGTVNDPKVELAFGSGGADGQPTVKEQIKDVIDTKKKELEEKAKAEVERLKQEAERMKQEAETKAKAEAERLKKEAEAKAKAEADRLKKELEQKAKKEAEDKLKNLFGKPK